MNVQRYISRTETISVPNFFFFNLFLTALGLCCCVRAFLSCSEWGLLFVVMCGLLIAVASLWCRAQALGAWAQ